jgi:hypothetical protein
MHSSMNWTRRVVAWSGLNQRHVASIVVLASICLGITCDARAQARDEDGPAYPVNQIYLDFAEDLPVHPPVKLMMKLDIKLGETNTGYVSPRDGVKTVTIRMMDLPQLKNKSLHASAIQAIGNVVVQHFREWGYAGITVTPNKNDIDPKSGKDMRLEGQTALRLVVRSMTGRGRPLRVGAIWEGPDARDGLSYAVSQFIIEQSKLVPGQIDTKGLLKTAVIVAEDEAGLFKPRAGTKQIQVRLVDVPKLGNHTFYTSALYDVSEALTKAVGMEGVYVWPSVKDIDATGRDVRFANQTALRMTIQPGELPERPKYVEIVAKPDQPEVVEVPKDLPEVGDEHGKKYPVSQVIVEYAEDHPGLPGLADVMDTSVELTEVQGGYIAPQPGGETNTTVKLVELPTLRQGTLYGSAIRHINTRLVNTFNQKGFIGIYIAPHPDDITGEGNDVRPETQTAMRVLVRTGVVTEVRTIAAGDRVDMEDRVDNPAHDRIRENAPINTDEPNNLLRKDKLDEYIYFMNRHPGRRIDAAVSPGQDPGAVALDLMVTENKPWVIFGQISNTGTENTTEWRERFGFIHNQLTNNDDILSIDYITAGFEDSHTLIGSYEAPLFDIDNGRLRYKIEGMYNEFTASDVGAANQGFEGESWSAGGELIWNIWQQNESFIDIFAGATWQHVEVVDKAVVAVTGPGEDDFFLPHVGASFERVTNTNTFLASLEYEINAAGIAGTSKDQITKLGRLFPDEDAMRAVYDVYWSFYLEPVFNREAWEDTSTWESSTLAHEFVLHLRGQYAFDTRLNPQRERTIGGMFSVRGYQESLTAADSVLIVTGEYRFHLPRIFAPSQEPDELFGMTHKWRPQYVHGRPDWDLVFRAFMDWGATQHSKIVDTFERDETLWGGGIGAELLIRRNLSIRVDWGFVLDEVIARGNGNSADIGDNRVHILGTLLY